MSSPGSSPYTFLRQLGYKSPYSYPRKFPPAKMSQQRMQIDGPKGSYERILPYKRPAKKNYTILRKQLARNAKIHSFKRTYNVGSSSTSGATETNYAVNFSLNDLPGFTEITAMYDFYKITGITYKWIPYQTNSISVSSINNVANVPIFYCVDTSDATAPTSVNEVCEYNDHKMARVMDGFKIFFRPKFADATAASRDGWVATSNPSLNWFGLKVSIPPTTNAMSYYQTWTIYIKCKDPK